MNQPLPQLLQRVIDIRRDGGQVLGCLLVGARGSTPQSTGALMLVDDAATLYGTVGGGCVEAEVRKQAHRMLLDGRTGVLRFKLDHDYGWDDGLICGGTVEVAVGALPPSAVLEAVIDAIRRRNHTSLEISTHVEGGYATYTLDLPQRPRLLIAGAGHIGAALARQALHLEFDVTLFDDRADLLERSAPPGAHIVVGDIAQRLRASEIDGETYCVIVTRGHRHDAKALHAVADRGARYIGMIGSRRKVKLTFDELMERGVRPEALADVCAPVGLEIGAVLVEEIALSIAAQLVEVRRSKRERPVCGPVVQRENAHASRDPAIAGQRQA